MAGPVTLIALLYGTPAAEAEFEAFESQAHSLMRHHGGAIERRVVLEGGSDEEPDEVHLVTAGVMP